MTDDLPGLPHLWREQCGRAIPGRSFHSCSVGLYCCVACGLWSVLVSILRLGHYDRAQSWKCSHSLVGGGGMGWAHKRVLIYFLSLLLRECQWGEIKGRVGEKAKNETISQTQDLGSQFVLAHWKQRSLACVCTRLRMRGRRACDRKPRPCQ